MSTLFPPHKPFLYPQFETYRFHSIDPDTDVTAYTLPGSGATQSRVGYNTHHLGFKEVRARISWNHLATGRGGRGVYVDTDWNVIGVQLKDDLSVNFSTLAALPTPVGSSEAAQHPEYPSIIALDGTHWAVSSGSGSLYILQTTSADGEEFKGDWSAHYDLTLPSSSSPVPFLIQAGHAVSASDFRLLLSRAVPSTDGRRPQTTKFELVEISVDPSRRTDVDGDNLEGMAVRWMLQGGDLPYHCSWSNGGWLVLSGETFAPENDIPVEEPAAPDPEPVIEMAAAPAKGKLAKRGLGALSKSREQSGNVTPASEDDVEAEDHRPFTWTQDGDSAIIRIPFPPFTTREDLVIDLGTTFLDISLSEARVSEASSSLQSFLQRSRRTFWAEIDLELSTFTFNPKTCIVEVDLGKVGDPNRWPSIFLPEDDDEEEVPETIPQSQMKAMRELFASQVPQIRDEPAGNHPAIPSLLREEMDYDIDDGEDYGDAANDGAIGDMGGSKIGREVFVGYIKDGNAQWSRSSTSVLSLPLTSLDNVADSDGGIIVKSAVDGLLFTRSENPARTAWDHKSTSPALSFVLSSKRDLRTVRHIVPSPPPLDIPPSPKKAKTDVSVPTTVLAFEAGSSSAGQGNLYVYYPPNSKTAAKQGVVTVSGGDHGALLGVGSVRKGDKDVILALCEKTLVVLHGILQS